MTVAPLPTKARCTISKQSEKMTWKPPRPTVPPAAPPAAAPPAAPAADRGARARAASCASVGSTRCQNGRALDEYL